MATKQKRYVKVKVRVGNKFLEKWKDTKTGKTYWNKPIFDQTRQSKPGLGVPTDKKTTERQKEGWKKTREFNKSQGGGELGVGKAQKQVKEIKTPTKDEGYGAHVRGQQKKDAPKDTVKTTSSDTSEPTTEKKEDSANKEKLKSTKMHAIEKKNREIHGNKAVDRLKQKHKEWKKARKEGKLDEWKKKWKKK
tara:strand:+ start:214 stop:789 length:576 start_codon:yes stop_codon:yes gene_type:complete